jgi:hypothetical protein
MVVNLRLMERAEHTVTAAFGSCHAFERYLNNNVCWVFQQTERRRLNGVFVEHPPSTILLSGNCKVVLARPRPSNGNFNNEIQYVILTVLNASRDDRADALKGRELDEPIRIFNHNLLPATILASTQMTPLLRVQENSATVPKKETDHVESHVVAPVCPACGKGLIPGRGIYCQHCRCELPANLGVHKEIVVAVRKKDYQSLATHMKQSINVAWSRMLKGRKVTNTVSSMGQTIFVISVQDEAETSTLAAEIRLNDLLEDAGVGRLTTDSYEISQVNKMLGSESEDRTMSP